MKIAFFDSGVGGLTVFNEALQRFPNQQYIYFADSYHAPYGALSQERVTQLILEATDFLWQKNMDAMVIACHTASRLMASELRKIYDIPIIGMSPGDSLLTSKAKVLVCATDLSVDIWKNTFIDTSFSLSFASLQKLISFAEGNQFYASEVHEYLLEKLSAHNWDEYEAILLGCTHFPYFTHQIRSILPPHVKVLDGSSETINRLESFIHHNQPEGKAGIEYFISGHEVNHDFLSPNLDYLRKHTRNHLTPCE